MSQAVSLLPVGILSYKWLHTWTIGQEVFHLYVGILSDSCVHTTDIKLGQAISRVPLWESFPEYVYISIRSD
jgi:hypothetical protein